MAIRFSPVILLVLSLLLVLFPSPSLSSGLSEDLSCVYEKTHEPYNSGDTFMMCMNFLPLLIKENLYVQVGKTTILHQKYLWRIFHNIPMDIIVQVANSTTYSSATPYNRPQNNMAFPFLVVTITMDYGKVIDIHIAQIPDVCPEEMVSTKILPKFYKTSKWQFHTNSRSAQGPNRKDFFERMEAVSKSFREILPMGIMRPFDGGALERIGFRRKYA